MRCPDAQALLAAYVDHLLSPAEREQVDAHVSACDVCRAELASWTEALDGLEASVPESAPDLWSQFQERVRVEAAPLTCAQAVQLVPGSGEALLTPREAADLEGHLAACAPCRAEEARLDDAVRMLEAVAASTHAPDLWPAFLERLEREQVARPSWHARLAMVCGWLFPEQLGWTRPALVIGGLALAAFLLRGPQAQTHVALSTPGLAVVTPEPAPPVASGPHLKRSVKHTPVTPALSRGVRIAEATIPRHVESHRRRWHRAWRSSTIRVASRVRSHAPMVAAQPPHDDAQTRVAMTHPVETPQDVPNADWQPGVAPQEVGTVREAAQAEVVHAVAMLAGLEDTARRPFEMNADEQ